MPRYCRRCLYPNTKPGLSFDAEGVCGACRNFERRAAVDWDARREELVAILERHRSQAAYDCLVPAGGGKDGMCQVLRILELGYHPLVVAVRPELPTEVGVRNLETMRGFGADVIEVGYDPRARKALSRRSLIELGDVSWPENYTVYTAPVNVAVRLGIPLLIWGENPADEYGGPAAVADGPTLSREWFEEQGGLHQRRIEDFVDNVTFRDEDAALYRYPNDEDLAQAGVTGLFLGYYFPWDGLSNFLVAQAHGFEAHPKRVEGTILSFEHIDSYLIGVHDYFKFLKFGFGRVTDVVCNQVRRGRMDRRQALELVRLHDGEFPWSYLGKPLAEILRAVEMSVDEFVAVCDKFTNRDVFRFAADGSIVKAPDGRPLLREPPE